MAHGFTCIHCGWQETPHLRRNDFDEDELTSKNEGYKYSLGGCPGYESSEPDQEGEAVKKDENLKYQQAMRGLGALPLSDDGD